jgi:hypothetical protein
MAAAYGMQGSWLDRNAGYIVVGGLGAAFGAWVLYPYLKSIGALRASGRQGVADQSVADQVTADQLRQWYVDQAEVRAREREFVSPAASAVSGPFTGYTGYQIGPRGEYPGAKGPLPSVPVYGTYRASAKLAFGDEQGPPIGPGLAVQSVAERQPALGFRGQSRAALEEHHTSAAHDPVDLGAIRPVDIGYEDVSGDQTAPPLRIVPYTEQFPYPGYSGYLAFGDERGAPPGFRWPVQSVATASEAVADQAYADTVYDRRPSPYFPYWRPSGQSGPWGNARVSIADRVYTLPAAAPGYYPNRRLFDEDGGYVSPGAYHVGADSTYKTPAFYPKYRARGVSREEFFPAEHSTVAPGFPTIVRDLSLANTIDIQTQDYPGGEGSYNLSVGNLPVLANGNLSAPVTYQQLSVGGGVAPGEVRGLPEVGHPYLG